jgi:hypothetical protein
MDGENLLADKTLLEESIQQSWARIVAVNSIVSF